MEAVAAGVDHARQRLPEGMLRGSRALCYRGGFRRARVRRCQATAVKGRTDPAMMPRPVAEVVEPWPWPSFGQIGPTSASIWPKSACDVGVLVDAGFSRIAQLPERCGKEVARHASRRVASGEPGALRRLSKSCTSCRKVARRAEIPPKFDQIWLESANTGQNLTKSELGRLRISSGRIGQYWPSSWPNLSELGQTSPKSADLDRRWSKLRNPACSGVAQHLRKSCRTFAREPIFGELLAEFWRNFGGIWPTPVNICRTLAECWQKIGQSRPTLAKIGPEQAFFEQSPAPRGKFRPIWAKV